MRVLHVYSGNLYGGIEAILGTLARGQRGTGATHAFALSFEGRLSRELAAAGAEVHHIGAVRASRPRTVLGARARLAQVLADGGFDRVVCHAPWSLALFGGVVRRARVPLVFWAHDVVSGRHWTERLARQIPPDLAIANSAFTASTLPGLFAGVPSAVVYAPVEARHDARSTADARREIRRAHDTPDSHVVIVQASRSEAWKGHRVLVEALAALIDLPGWTWWQVGGAQRPSEARFLASIRQLARANQLDDRVRWLGERDDVPALFSAADVYCQPNLEPEPFGVVFVEALAAGLPVVTSAIGGAPEIVDDTCGLLVPPGDVDAVAAALRRLVSDREDRCRRGSAGPSRARQVSDPARRLSQLAGVLDTMAGVEAIA